MASGKGNAITDFNYRFPFLPLPWRDAGLRLPASTLPEDAWPLDPGGSPGFTARALPKELDAGAEFPDVILPDDEDPPVGGVLEALCAGSRLLPNLLN